jgi:DNA recombination protein RmuC
MNGDTFMTMDTGLAILAGLLALGVVWFAARHSVSGHRVKADNAEARAKALEEQSLRFRNREVSDAETLASLKAQLEGQVTQAAAQETELRRQLDTARQAQDADRERAEALGRALAESRGQLEGERRSLRERTTSLEQLQERATALEGQLREAEQSAATARQELGSLREDHRAAQERLATQQDWVTEQGQQLKAQFGELAGQLLAEKSSTLQQHNNNSIDDILSPLRTQLAEFQARINEVHELDAHDRAGLSQLMDGIGRTQQQLSGHAEALSRALATAPGSSGALGGMRLELQLQAAGFEEGRHYLVPQGDQAAGMPGVALRLPDQTGYLPVDTAFSLAAWEEAAAAGDEAARNAALDRHVEALRQHLAALGARRHADLADGEKAIPFTLLYLPLEAAAPAALERDSGLLALAHHHKVVLATPGTLFLVMGMVAQLWRVAAQELHARTVAAEGALLLGKLDEFAAGFGEIGAALDGARQLFAAADTRLRSGDNNAIAVGQRMKLLAAQQAAPEPLPAAPETAAPPQPETLVPFEPMPQETELFAAS